MNRIVKIMSILLLSSFFWLSYQVPFVQAQVKEVVIGGVFPLSGPLAPIGKHMKDAIEVAVMDINQAGGIKSLGGAKVKVIFGDSTGDPKVGVTEIEKLIIKDRVSAVIGAYQSGVTLPMGTVAERYGIPFYATGSDEQITARGYKYTFRSNEISTWYTRDNVNFAVEIGKKFGNPINTAALVWENTSWGQGAHKYFLQNCERVGIKVVMDESYPHTISDMTPIVTKIKAAKPDAILVIQYLSDAILFVNTLAEMEVDVKALIARGGGYSDKDFIPGIGKNCEYIFDSSRWEPDFPRPGSKEIMERFLKYSGAPMLDPEEMKHYSYTWVLAEGINKAASTDPKKIRDALATLRIKAPHPAIRFAEDELYFDATGQAFKGDLSFVQFREINGKMQRVTVWPEKMATQGIKPVFPVPKWSERKKK